MNIKLVLFFQLSLLIFGPGSFSISHAINPVKENYEAFPSSIISPAPPLVMLVVGPDHKLYSKAHGNFEDFDQGHTGRNDYQPQKKDYQGYFDCYKYYLYSLGRHYFEPIGITKDKKAPNGKFWSGDFLNYLTMSHMDLIRKTLYGGKRLADTDSETILERAYIPQDAHSFGYEYKSPTENGFDIRQYSPLDLPHADTRHLLVNTSLADPVDSDYMPLFRVWANSSHRIWDWLVKPRPVCDNNLVLSGSGFLNDYAVRVKVTNRSIFQNRLKQYSAGNYKPVGILQRYGENQEIYFGLLSGSYTKNTSGGVLRKNISSICDEINPKTGCFTGKNGIIRTLDQMRIVDFDYRGHLYNIDCGDIADKFFKDGHCRMWGNPLGEMMFETLRYFSGAAHPTKEFTYTGAADNAINGGMPLDLPKPAWINPYDQLKNQGFAPCSKPIMLVLDNFSPSYDSDQLPGSFFSSKAPEIIGTQTLNVSNLTDLIGRVENINDFKKLCGLRSGSLNQQGSYYSATLACYGNTQDINSAPGNQQVKTIMVGYGKKKPQINIKLNNQNIILLPYARAIKGLGINADEMHFQPTAAITGFFVEHQSAVCGRFIVSFDELEQGGDYDMDVLIAYEYQLVDSADQPVSDPDQAIAVDITLTSENADAQTILHCGYIISGSTADGIYLEVRDINAAEDNDLDYYLDTPPGVLPQSPISKWQDNLPLPLQATRQFKASHSSSLLKLENPFWYAAKWGGFDDKNQNGIPDQRAEWDKNQDDLPDTYVKGTEPAKLEQLLERTYADISSQPGSGTSPFILPLGNSSAANLFQTCFKAGLAAVNTQAGWIGYLRSLWIDPCGNLREDSNHNFKLDLFNHADSNQADSNQAEDGVDRIIRFITDKNGLAWVRRYSRHFLYNPLNQTECDCPGNCAGQNWNKNQACPDLNDADNFEQIPIDQINPLFEAGKMLALRKADTRNIFTFIDGNGKDDDQDGQYDQAGEIERLGQKRVGLVENPLQDNPFDGKGELVEFHTANAKIIKPFLGLKDDKVWAYLEPNLQKTDHNGRVNNLINYIRGKDSSQLKGQPGTRNRKVQIKNRFVTWKLGDIIHSSPKAVAGPVRKYNIIYQDESYQAYSKAVSNRETVVYAGANDGLLHAFTSGIYNKKEGRYFLPENSLGKIGDEIWAYLPQTLLPHLKWLADPDYQHTYYVDLTPLIVEADILADDTHYIDSDSNPNWGTFLLGGLNMGGKEIQSTGDFDQNIQTLDVSREFFPTYFCLDITQPRQPRLLWERSYKGLGQSRSVPAVIKVKDRWLAVFGSGPRDLTGKSDYQGFSDQTGHIFVVDLKTGNPLGQKDNEWCFEINRPNSFFNSPAAFDQGLDYEVDAVYLTGTSRQNGLWQGSVYKISTRKNGRVMSNPAKWNIRQLFTVKEPLSEPLALSVDAMANLWLYFGTGRNFSADEKINRSQQYLIGLKDPEFSKAAKAKMPFNIDKLHGVIGKSPKLSEKDRGWYRKLAVYQDRPSERLQSMPVICGGKVWFSTFKPVSDACSAAGSADLYEILYMSGGENKNNKSEKSMQFNNFLSPPSFHFGLEKGGTAYFQAGSGAILQLPIEPVLNIKSGVTAWREK